MIFFSVCGIRSGYRTSQHRVKRIVQGNVADYAEWPWQLSLRKDYGTYLKIFLRFINMELSLAINLSS